MKVKKIFLSALFIVLIGICSVQVFANNDTNSIYVSNGTGPQLNSITVTRDSGLRLEWTAGSNASDINNVKYMILRSSDGGKSFQGVVNREAKYGLYFVDATGLEAGKEYFYKVREYVNGVQGEDSNIVSATAENTLKADNEFEDKNLAAEYLKEKMVQREQNIQIIYNAPSFPSGLGAELYDMAREDTESTDSETADEGDYLRYTIVPGTIDINSGIDGKVGENTSYVFNFSIEYYTTKEDELQVDEKVQAVLDEFRKNGITSNSAEYDKAKAVYDYLSKTVHYNNQKRPDNGNLMITAYDSLVRQEAQCYGQLMGAYRLLKELGLPVRRINGQTNVELGGKTDWVNHGWNIVKIGDVWYNFDVTAAASYFEGYGQKNLLTYKYLLVSENDFSERYKRSEEYDTASVFFKQHPMSQVSFGYEPEAPSDLSLTSISKTSIMAEYSAVENADGYVLLRAENENGPFVKVGESKTTKCQDNSVVAGKEYHYKVQAYKTVQKYIYYSAYSPRRIIVSKEMGTPLNTAASVKSYNTVAIEWEKVSGAQFYEVWRSNNENDGYVKLATLDSNSLNYNSKNLMCGTTYYYKVRAYAFNNGERVFGNFGKVVSARPILSSPQNVQAKSNTYNTLKISWNVVDGANYYQVYRSGSKDGKYVQLGTYDSETFSSISRSLGCGTEYYYKVRAYRWVGGERIFSAFSSVASAKPILTAPQNVSAKGETYNTVRINWDMTDGANYYQVYRSDSMNGKYVLLGTYDDKTKSSLSRSLGCGKTYYYKVRAYRWVGGERIFSAFSNIANAKPTLSAPQKVTAESASSTTVRIKWNAVAGAQYYQVYRSTSANGKYALLGTYDEKTTNSISKALKKGTTYYYKVRAYRWVGGERVFSSFSEVTSAIPK